MRINALQRDVIRRHVGPFLFCSATILFLLLMQFLILYLDKIIGKGLPFWVILELILMQVPSMVVLAVPMSVLVSTLIAFGQFSEQNELTAVKAAGISPWKLMSPILVLGLLLSVFMAWFSNWVLPEANFKAKSLFIDIRMKKPGFDLKPNLFYDGIAGYTFHASRISEDADTLHDITIFQDQTEKREQAVIGARWGILSAIDESSMLELNLHDGMVFRYLAAPMGEAQRIEETKFGHYLIRFDLSDLQFSRTNPEIRNRDDRTMSAQAMAAVRDSLNEIILQDLATMMERQSLVVLRGEPLPADSLITTPIRLSNSDSSGAAVRTPYVTLNRLRTIDDQRFTTLQSLQIVRNAIADIEGIKGGVQWRFERMAQYLVEIHKKLAIPMACVVFVLLGAPLGMLVRKGNLGFHAVLSTVLFTYYWITIIQGEKMADRLVITPFVGMWFGNATLAAVGFLLLYRLSTERRLKDLWS
jgi:lipopolysaccharide export system permease protein